MYSCLFITSYYHGFIKKFYQTHLPLETATYDSQLRELHRQFFGDSDFYSKGLINAGWKAEDIIFNCSPLQEAWAKEHDFSGNAFEILIEQICRKKPEVVYLHDMSLGTTEFLSAIRSYTDLICGQIACPIFPRTDLNAFDIIFSSFPHYVERFRKLGITAYYQPLAFEPRVLGNCSPVERAFPVTFVGGISPAHRDRNAIFQKIAKFVPIEFWGYGAENLPLKSEIRKRHHGEAWGLDMFSVLNRSRVTLNRHIDVAENYANNMRLFEATGCGALLVTDYKDNLNELFEVGKEVVAYRSAEECAALVNYYLNHPEEAELIAKKGQARTLREHIYQKRMNHTAEILERHLRYDKVTECYNQSSRISYGHIPLRVDQITKEMEAAWKHPKIPAKQRGVVQSELAGMYKGQTPAVYKVLADTLYPFIDQGCSVLEIGCASGYYYEALEYLLKMRIRYTGVDFSLPLIKMAKDFYKQPYFNVADGSSLPFKDGQFTVAISSCILLHVPNYPEHIKETERVSGRFVVAHRTPVCRKRPTQLLKKFAYDVETVELIFNESEIISEFTSNGLKLIKANEYFANQDRDHYEVTYLFEKKNGSKHFVPEYCPGRIGRASSASGMLDKPKLLNLGCGGRFHQDWTNMDFHASAPEVISHNLCLGIPEPDQSFDVVYHSHLLEHFPKSYAKEFLKECYRVLKQKGIIRVVQPDLEKIARLYLDALDRSLQGDREAQERYEWILLELFDQMVRNRSGGEMLEYWKKNPMPAEDFVIERCGSEVLGALRQLRRMPPQNCSKEDPYLKVIRHRDAAELKQMTRFRMSGEVHQWLYDRYSLMRLLKDVGFTEIRLCRANESEIPNFNNYFLDIEPNGKVRKPDSFFMEARK